MGEAKQRAAELAALKNGRPMRVDGKDFHVALQLDFAANAVGLVAKQVAVALGEPNVAEEMLQVMEVLHRIKARFIESRAQRVVLAQPGDVPPVIGGG